MTTRPTKILIHISGGVLTNITAYGEPEVFVIDHDHLRDGDCPGGDIRGIETFRHPYDQIRTKGVFRDAVEAAVDEAIREFNAAKLTL